MASHGDPVSEFEWLVRVLVWTDFDDRTNGLASGYRTGI